MELPLPLPARKRSTPTSRCPGNKCKGEATLASTHQPGCPRHLPLPPLRSPWQGEDQPGPCHLSSFKNSFSFPARKRFAPTAMLPCDLATQGKVILASVFSKKSGGYQAFMLPSCQVSQGNISLTPDWMETLVDSSPLCSATAKLMLLFCCPFPLHKCLLQDCQHDAICCGASAVGILWLSPPTIMECPACKEQLSPSLKIS